MMRNYHGMRRIRRFFSVSPSIKAAGEKTTDEKAAEVKIHIFLT